MNMGPRTVERSSAIPLCAQYNDLDIGGWSYRPGWVPRGILGECAVPNGIEEGLVYSYGERAPLLIGSTSRAP